MLFTFPEASALVIVWVSHVLVHGERGQDAGSSGPRGLVLVSFYTCAPGTLGAAPAPVRGLWLSDADLTF